MTVLQALYIFNNDICPEEIAALARGFKFLKALQVLDLSHNSIGPDGTSALANGIEFLTCNTEAIGMMVLTLAGGFKFLLQLRS